MTDLVDLRDVVFTKNGESEKLKKDEIKSIKESLKLLGWRMEQGILYSPSDSIYLNNTLFDTDRNDIIAVLRKRLLRLGNDESAEEYDQLLEEIEKRKS